MHSLNNPSLLSQVLTRGAPLAVPSGTCGGAVGVGADVSLGHAPANASDTCPDGQHAAPLRTYIVSAAGYELRLHPTTTVDDASPLWLELEVPLASFSGALPVLESVHVYGMPNASFKSRDEIRSAREDLKVCYDGMGGGRDNHIQ